MCVNREDVISVWPRGLVMTNNRFAQVAAAWEARGPLTTEEIIELVKALGDSDALICVVPEGFELTEERWDRILEAWEAGGCELLGPEEVLALFDLSPTDPPPPSP